jgi:CBS domain-containing protein
VKVKNVMHREVATVQADDSMSAAAGAMWEHDCGCVPVVDGERRVVGIVTDRDLCMAAHMRNLPLSALAVREAMAREVHCCHDEERVSAVHEAMRRHQVRRLPVVDAEGRLVGIVSLNDLALAAAEARVPQIQGLDVARTLAEISRHRQLAHV